MSAGVGYIKTGSPPKRPTGLAKLEDMHMGQDVNKADAENIENGAYKSAVKPDWLDEVASAEWDRLSPILERLSLLDETNQEMFAAYCTAYSRWREAEIFITENGSIVKTPSGYWQQVPQVAIAQHNLKIMLNLSSRFGLTPGDRARLDLETLPAANDPLDNLLMD